MDVYLPNDFYQLRDGLPDWREAADACRETDTGPAREDSADPSWQTI
jgi:hypothetical protein